MYLSIVFLPLIGALITGFFGRFFGYYGACLLSTTCVFLSMVLSLLSFYESFFSESVVHLHLNS